MKVLRLAKGKPRRELGIISYKKKLLGPMQLEVSKFVVRHRFLSPVIEHCFGSPGSDATCPEGRGLRTVQALTA